MEAQWTLYTGEEDFRGREDIVRVRLAPNVTEIRDAAFLSCPNLKEVDLGNVTKIGSFAFMECHSLINLRLPPTVIEIGEDAFSICVWLERVDLGNVTKIESRAFACCRSLEHLRLPPTVIEIGDQAFYECVGLERVELGNVTKIGAEAFKHCRSLLHLRLPRTVFEIGAGAFSYCSELESVDLGNVTKIGREAFSYCHSLVNLPLPRTVVEIGDHAFLHCKELVEVDLSHLELRKIKRWTFALCVRLNSLTLPTTLVAIDDSAFHLCRSLQSVELHNGLQKIGPCAFSGCPLMSLAVPSTLMSIGDRAFCGCVSLRTVDFGFIRGVHHIREAAFGQCFSLQSISMPPNAFVIEWGVDPHCVRAEEMIFFVAERDVALVERTVVSGNLGQNKRILSEMEQKINSILGRQHRTNQDSTRSYIDRILGLIRSMITHVKMVDATTCLELALLKASMDKERNLAAAPITRKRRRETRENSRVTCGAEIIIPNVLLFLDGS